MIEDHFMHNCIPSIPREFANAAEQAIEAVQDGEHGKLIELPSGVAMTAITCVEFMHLYGFIEVDEE